MESKQAHWIVSAPGRVNLIGEHVDYNAGLVLPAAISFRTTICASPNASQVARFRSGVEAEPLELDLGEPVSQGDPHWTNYVRGVIAGFQERGVALQGFDAEISTTLPIGGGLSSSAALEVAVATLLEEISGTKLGTTEKARLCQKAEREFAGVPCGLMDQLAAVHGLADHFLLIDCHTEEVTPVPFLEPDLGLLIFDTQVRHELANSAYAQRRKSCEEAARLLGLHSLREATQADLDREEVALGSECFRRARHVVGEIERTREAAAALRERDWGKMASLMARSHRSLRDDYEVSCAELDLVVELAEREPEILGCRMTGGGFGGCAIALIRMEQASSVAARLRQKYQDEVGIEPRTFFTRPSSGARVDSHLGPAIVSLERNSPLQAPTKLGQLPGH